MNDKQIKQVFERMTPDDATEQRVLESILANQHKNAKPRKQKRHWRVILPLAACIVILAGIGLFTLGSFDVSSLVSSSSSSSEGSKQYQSTTEDSTFSTSTSPLSSAESQSVPDVEQSTLAVRYPTIQVDGFGTFTTIPSPEQGYIAANQTLVGDLLARGTAYTTAGDQTVGCSLYQYHDTESSGYAIRYDGDESYFRASPIAP